MPPRTLYYHCPLLLWQNARQSNLWKEGLVRLHFEVQWQTFEGAGHTAPRVGKWRKKAAISYIHIYFTYISYIYIFHIYISHICYISYIHTHPNKCQNQAAPNLNSLTEVNGKKTTQAWKPAPWPYTWASAGAVCPPTRESLLVASWEWGLGGGEAGRSIGAAAI